MQLWTQYLYISYIVRNVNRLLNIVLSIASSFSCIGAKLHFAITHVNNIIVLEQRSVTCHIYAIGIHKDGVGTNTCTQFKFGAGQQRYRVLLLIISTYLVTLITELLHYLAFRTSQSG